MAQVLTRRESSGKGPVCGIGIYEPSVLCMTDSPELRRAYRAWNDMLTRAAPKYAQKYPSYAGVSVDPAFHRFADFATWAMQQIGWNTPGFQLDKDILIKGNRVYAPDRCVFVPLTVNSLLCKGKASRGDYPIGVKREKGMPTFVAVCGIDGKRVRLGTFATTGEAFAVYKAAKEQNIRRVADQYRDQIDPRAYAALLAYQVEITD